MDYQGPDIRSGSECRRGSRRDAQTCRRDRCKDPLANGTQWLPIGTGCSVVNCLPVTEDEGTSLSVVLSSSPPATASRNKTTHRNAGRHRLRERRPKMARKYLK
ncbi:hypothetical protein RvY_06083-3 [Ramazzottius varieornatus]|uniref:Uncharacterized protein n=1 Tax=Ramazzottius varieornatus TaxID=947166 RepID=A0A1D1V0A3_RAMVA|nr:hypothetical protein RvY_06083-3 [Ramazzottius varieornatus]